MIAAYPERLPGTVLLGELRARGYTGGITILREHVSALRPVMPVDRTPVMPAMREIAEAMAEADEQRAGPAGLLRIDTSEGAGEQTLERIVLAFLRRYPDMQVEVVTDGRLVNIVAQGFDAGVRLRDMVPRDMIAVPFGGDQRHIVVAAPSYLEGKPTPASPAELKDHICIRYL